MICYSKDMVFLGEHVEKSCKAEMKGNKYTYSASKYLEWKQERKARKREREKRKEGREGEREGGREGEKERKKETKKERACPEILLRIQGN